MTFIVEYPHTYVNEREYILSVLLKEFIGLDVQFKEAERADVRITADDGQELIIADGLFEVCLEEWLSTASLPQQPLKVWDVSTIPVKMNLSNTLIPVIYGADPESSELIKMHDKSIDLRLDIFGSCFFMLTRYEEIVKTDRDRHDRFPAEASIAFQEGFLDRPIVNEYLEILWGCMKHLWPGLCRKEREYELLLSHDVDRLFLVAGMALTRAIMRVGGDVIRRRDLGLAIRSMAAYVCSLSGELNGDPCNTFDFIMDTSDKYGLRSVFYFMMDYSCTRDNERGYKVSDQWLKALITHIHKRGYELGLHLNYNSYLDAKQTKKEFNALLETADLEGIKQERWGSRQHYLRWHNPSTWQNLEDSGIAYDSTLTFFNQIGFRCGVCYEYPVFNLITRKRLNLYEQPLIVMDDAFRYMGTSWMTDYSKNAIIELNQKCKKYNGISSLLWHNHFLASSKEKIFYDDILKSLCVQ